MVGFRDRAALMRWAASLGRWPSCLVMISKTALRRPSSSRWAGAAAAGLPPTTASGVSDDERRRGQIIGANQRMNAALKVAISAGHGNGDQIFILYGG